MTAAFGPQKPDQGGYFAGIPRQMVKVGDTAVLNLSDGQGLTVALNDPSVATATEIRPGTFNRPSVEPQAFTVQGVKNLGEANLEAKDAQGVVQAFIQIGVGPVDAAFVTQPGMTQSIDAGASATVQLNDGNGLTLALTVPALASITETTNATGTVRTFAVQAGPNNGSAVLEARSPSQGATPGWLYAFMHIEVVNGVTVARNKGAVPTDKDAQTTITHDLDAVPSELLDAAEKGSLDISAKPAGLTDAQAKFLCKYFLYAVDVLAERHMPRRSALLLAAQTGIETSWGSAGPNVAQNNFLSFQPPPAQQESLKAKGVPIVMGARENKPGVVNQGTPCPSYKDVRQSIEMEIDIAFKEIYLSMLTAVRSSTTTAEQYAAAADGKHYSGVKYGKPAPETNADGTTKPVPLNFPDEYGRAAKFLKKMLQTPPSGMSADTKVWMERLRLEILTAGPR